MARYYFRIPFATSGDKTAVPVPIQGGGEVSYTEGFGFDYQREIGVDPDALLIVRENYNELSYQEELAIKDLQEWYVPEFITTAENGGAPFSYSQKMRVKLSGEVYESLTNSNTTTPPSANWIIVPTTGTVGIPETTAGGTNNDVTAVFPFPLSTLAQNIIVGVRSASANTTAMTFNPDGLGVRDVYKGANAPIASGDVPSAGYWMLLQRDQTLDKWQLINPFVSVTAVPDASETVKGILEIATTAEAQAGTDDLRAITPLKLQQVTATQTRKGVLETSTDLETQTGANTDVAVTPASLSSRTALTTRTGIAFLATQAEVNAGSVTDKIVTPATLQNKPASMPTGYISKLLLSNNALDSDKDLDVGVGNARSTNLSMDMIVASAIGKRIDAPWASGGTPASTTGGFPTGITLTNGTWYRVFLLGNPSTGVVNMGFDTSATASNLLTTAAVISAGMTAYRQIGWCDYGNQTGSKLSKFYQVGNEFTFSEPEETDTHASTGVTTAFLMNINAPPTTEVLAKLAFNQDQAAVAQNIWYNIWSPISVADVAPTANRWNHVKRGENDDPANSNITLNLLSDPSSQVRGRSISDSGGGNNGTYTVSSLGWIDTRGM